MSRDISKRSALRFVILLGAVSLFADVTYEGARSITGPYLAILGASGTAVGVVAGFGELTGYGFRLISGYLADRSRRYWLMTILGYAVNLLAVPLLALAGNWPVAAMLIIAERLGKAIRTPPRDAMLSHATAVTGHGSGFGLHEAMDQIGAIAGPLIVAAILYFKKGYTTSFAVLLVPALLALSVLILARILYAHPRDFEIRLPSMDRHGLPRKFWIYLAAMALVAAGFIDFPLIAFHLKRISIAPDHLIPTLYAAAMGVDALAALIFGRLLDRFGIPVLTISILMSAFLAPLIFYGRLSSVIAGLALWGIGMGAQESIVRAAIAEMIPADRRGSAYGIFHAAYGISWFLGSALIGMLYDVSVLFLIIFSVLTQLLSIPILLRIREAD